MSTFDHLVPPALLADYAKAVWSFRRCLGICPHTCAQLDRHRQSIHDEILRTAGKTRDDRAFAFWLATTLEDHIAFLEDPRSTG